MIQSEDILESIFELGIKITGIVSNHFLETVRSFYLNGYDSPQLKSLIAFLEDKQILDRSHRGKGSSSHKSNIYKIHEGDDESNETL